jgi:NADH-quinone oxidoreductase subunit D
MFVNMGPQHPSTHGVLRLLLKTDGEIVEEVQPHVGYLHRCAEKIGENLNSIQFVPYTDRLDYLSSMSDNLGYCLAVEKLLGVDVPPKAQHLRVIMAELNRIASHLIAFGTYGIDIGAFTPFMWALREREIILNLFERISGARLTYNYVRIGGVMRDMDKVFETECRRFLKEFPEKVQEYNDILTYNQIFINRTKGLGHLPIDLALAYGVTGPNLRASGYNLDVRKFEPYSGYEKFAFDVPLGKGVNGQVGDCWDRYYVRIQEMAESSRIVQQALDSMPSGEFWLEKYKRAPKLPKGEVYYRIENPRGELGYYIVSDGREIPYRVKIRAPSFCNLSVLPEITRNVYIADVVAILGSIDIVLGEIDR